MGMIKYEIYSGAGNDFVMINNWEDAIPPEEQKDLTVKYLSVGFPDIDGIIFLDKPLGKEASIRMNYYNRDGSYGAMCGNGARCIAVFARDKGVCKENILVLEAVSDLYRAEIMDGTTVKVYFPEPKEINLDVVIKLEKAIFNASYVNVGSDHITIFLDDEINENALKTRSLDEIDIGRFGRELRFHPSLAPRGANVNFIVPVSDDSIRIRTYERGVERETLACGTGVVSSAVVSVLKGKAAPPVRVLSQSGEWLEVGLKAERLMVSELSLKGSARKIDSGVLSL